jgi:hypothetical protein
VDSGREYRTLEVGRDISRRRWQTLSNCSDGVNTNMEGSADARADERRGLRTP